MTQIAIDLPDGAFAALRKDPQEMGAEIAGVTRVEFMHALGRLGVSPFQEELDEADSFGD